MKIALIFSQVESNKVYCQVLNSAEDVLSFFFYRTLNPGKHRVQEGEKEVSHCRANVNITGNQP